MPRLGALLLCLAAATLPAARQAAAGEQAVRPGALFVEPATPQALGFRWPIRGDENGDATASLHYREAGAAVWRRGLDLLRVGLESRQSPRRPRGSVVLAGSLLGLTPDRRYEVRLTLTDPDGGGEIRTLELRTVPQPVLPPDLRRRLVTPLTASRDGPGSGSAEDPFNGLRAAVAAARPGDLLLLAPGRYLGGPLALGRSGEPGRPIVLQAAGDGPAVLEGGGAERLLDLSGLHDVWLRGLVLRGAGLLVEADRARAIVAQGNRFEVSRAGYVSKGAVAGESQGHFVIDNRFLGPTHWPRSKGIEHIFGVGLSGSGHVIAYNHLENFGDCIRGAWVEDDDGLLSASDIHHNDLQSCTDDGIEVDHADANVRVYANRITNVFAAISLQPIFGGPIYLYRNMIFNTLYSPFKLHNNTGGVLMLHNTALRAGIPFFIRTSTEVVRDSMTRNNLFVGGSGPALVSTASMIGCDFDADGYAWPAGAFARWNGATYRTPEEARAAGAPYGRIGAVALEAASLFEGGLLPPEDEAGRYESARNRPLLAAGSPAVDRGVAIPGVNDGFAGAAPDLGCCELGTPLPAVGPRPPFAD